MRWSLKILERDKVCVCGSPATEAHHIYSRKNWPELRINKDNGIGLCTPCHRAIYGEEEAHIERLLEGRPDQARTLGRLLGCIARSRGMKLGLELRR